MSVQTLNLSVGDLLLVLAGVFTVSLGYGVALPLLPGMVERFAAAETNAVAWYTGAAASLSTATLGLSAPLSGWLSDQHGRRVVALAGLAGFVPAMVLLGTADSLRGLFLSLAAAGICASAVLPVSSALLSDRSEGDVRARHLAWVGSATLLGFMAGPMVGGWLGSAKALNPALPAAAPFIIVAALAAIVWVYWHRRLPTATSAVSVPTELRASGKPALAYTIVLMYGVASFEVGLTLHSRQTLGLSARDLGMLFMLCSAIMLIFQALLYPLVRKHIPAQRGLALPFAALATAFALLPMAREWGTLAVLVALVSASAGIASPLISYQLASTTPQARGLTLGLQTTVSSTGQALGSLSAGVFFGAMAAGPFWLATSLFALGSVAARYLWAERSAAARTPTIGERR